MYAVSTSSEDAKFIHTKTWDEGPTTIFIPPIEETMAKKQYWHTQEILFLTEHFGKPFFYLKDVDGHIYGRPAKPVYQGVSIDGETGEETPVQVGWEPDLTR